MVELAEIAGRTHEVASAMNEAKAVLTRVERVLSEEAVDHALSRRLSDVQSLAASAERVSQREQDATRERMAAERGENGAQSDEADRALWAAFGAPYSSGAAGGSATDPISSR